MKNIEPLAADIVHKVRSSLVDSPVNQAETVANMIRESMDEPEPVRNNFPEATWPLIALGAGLIWGAILHAWLS